MKSQVLFVVAALCLCAGAAASTGETASLLAHADAMFAGRTVSTGAAEALDAYEKVAAADPENAAAKWKAARALHWLGDHTTGKEQRSFYESGIRLGEAAVKLDPASPDARFWLGALYGSYGEARGVLKSLSLVKPIREQMTALNAIDAEYGGGAGLRVLGIVDYKVPGFAGGSRKRAAEHLAAALKIDPSNPFNNYYMAEFLAETGKKSEASAYLAAVEHATTSPDVDTPDLQMIRAKARALEKKLAG
jgi:tetratricopeptide (TPR) repeat protein